VNSLSGRLVQKAPVRSGVIAENRAWVWAVCFLFSGNLIPPFVASVLYFTSSYFSVSNNYPKYVLVALGVCSRPLLHFILKRLIVMENFSKSLTTWPREWPR
jgi:hypothetical protein